MARATVPEGSRRAEVRFDAIMLAGGSARRLGGISKPDVLVAGRRLIDRTLDATAGAGVVVVVGPASVAPPGVLVTLEDPPSGGPVAGLAAGLAALPHGAPLVVVLACDVPRASGAVAALLGAVGDTDGAVLVDDGGRWQHLVGVYRRAALEGAIRALETSGGVRGAPVRRLVEGLRLVAVADATGLAIDVDTWADVRAAEAEIGL